MERMRDVNTRMRALVEAGIALSSELSLDAVLQQLVETAAELTGARYASARRDRPVRDGARAVPHDRHRRRDAGRIGELPRGRGILGVLIRERSRCGCTTSPRIRARSASRPVIRRCSTFLGVPVMLRGVAYGNLYLTEKAGGADFDEEDEELVDAARRPGRGRDRERAPVRVGDALVARSSSR